MDDEEDILLKKEELEVDHTEPGDLPAAQEAVDASEGKLIPDVSRICPSCGKEASRIVSNLNGRQGYCGPCKVDWPIGPPVASIGLPIKGRNATGKQSVVQPDWNLAFEDID